MPPAPAIALRPWVLEDAPRMAGLVNSPAVYRHLAAALPLPYTAAHAAEFIACCAASPDAVERAILVEGEAVGTVGAQVQGATATIGYWLGEAYHRRGLMSAALPLFITQLPPQVTQLRARVFSFNSVSQALLRRCGFRELAGERSAEPAQDGHVHPVLLFGRAR